MATASTFSSGLYASATSFPLLLISPSTHVIYLKYFHNYVYILFISALLLSSTFLGVTTILVLSMFGPWMVIVFPGLVVLTFALLWFNALPSFLISKVADGFILPFVSLPTMCFVITNIFRPVSSTEFIIQNIPHLSDHKRAEMRRRAKSHGIGYKLRISLSLLLIDVCINQSTRIATYFFPSALRDLLLLFTTSGLISLRLFSVYSLIVCNDSLRFYLREALANVTFFVGFGLPVSILRVVIERAAASAATTSALGGDGGATWAIKLVGSLIEMGVVYGMVGKCVSGWG